MNLRWIYVENNAINRLDPTGLISELEDPRAKEIIDLLEKEYAVRVQTDWGYIQPIYPFITSCKWVVGNWSIDELERLQDSISDLAKTMGSSEEFIHNLGRVKVVQRNIGSSTLGLTSAHLVRFSSRHFISPWTVTHEFSHAWDANYGWNLSKQLEDYTEGHTDRLLGILFRLYGLCDKDHRLPGCNKAGYIYGGVPPAGADNDFNRFEDFAESVTAYIYTEQAQDKV